MKNHRSFPLFLIRVYKTNPTNTGRFVKRLALEPMFNWTIRLLRLYCIGWYPLKWTVLWSIVYGAFLCNRITKFLVRGGKRSLPINENKTFLPDKRDLFRCTTKEGKWQRDWAKKMVAHFCTKWIKVGIQSRVGSTVSKFLCDFKSAWPIWMHWNIGWASSNFSSSCIWFRPLVAVTAMLSPLFDLSLVLSVSLSLQSSDNVAHGHDMFNV